MIIKFDIENLYKFWINEFDSNFGLFSFLMSKCFGVELL